MIYLAHPLNSRKKVRTWELEFETRTGIKLLNPFYDKERPEIKKYDNGEEIKKDELDFIDIVNSDLSAIDKCESTMALINEEVSYGTIMEMFYTHQSEKPVYSLVLNGKENHPWIQYTSQNGGVFTNPVDLERRLLQEYHRSRKND